MKKSFSGKNIDAALDKACSSLGVDKSELKYEVLAGQDGGFALIKVLEGGASSGPMVETLTGVPGSPMPSEREETDGRPERRERSERGGRGDRGRGDRGDRGRGGRGDRGRGGRGDRGDRGRGGRGGRGDRRDGGDRPRRDRVIPFPAIPEDTPTEATGTITSDGDLSPIAQEAFEKLTALLNAMQFGAEFTVNEDVQDLTFNLKSEALHPVLVHNDMEVLNALEQLLDRMLSQPGDDRLRIHVDSMGIKEQKDLDLSQAALDLAEEAIEKGAEMKMGPLDSRARRIVHLALKEHGRVTTHSEGQGAFRRVCIVPADES